MRRRSRENKIPIKSQKISRTEKKQRRVAWIAIALISIFFLVLFFNTYFNLVGEVGINPSGTEEWNKKFLLSGPDPYYNMRTIQITLETGSYPWMEVDNMLNYPLGATGAARPPLMNMFAILFSHGLSPFMSQGDAIGYSMQFIPALFGALLVFPIYFIGKNLFNKKVGIIAAFLVPLIPVHIASGHGSAYTLFDHDSMVLFLSAMVWAFYIMGLKVKEPKKALLFGALTGVSLGALSLTWISAQAIYIIIVACFVVLTVVSILREKIELNLFILTFVALFTGYLMYLPLSSTRMLELTLVITVGMVSLVALLLKKYRIPYILSLPSLVAAGGIFLGAIYLFRDRLAETTNAFLSGLSYISSIIFGAGIYGSKVDLTIAEARTFEISRAVMSFGPALYWLAMAGFVFILYYWYKDRNRSDLLFFAILYIIQMFILGIAGRFLNDLIPLVVVLSAFILWKAIEIMDFPSTLKKMRSSGTLRKSMKSFGLMRVACILIIILTVVFPNTYMALDAAIPAADHQTYFGNNSSPLFALSLYKEIYWVNALDWLSQQDTEIENPLDRPAFISWWDYGFYCSAVGGHPTVADNFQQGIAAAANFQTAASEEEAISVLIVRLMEGNLKKNNGEFSPEVKEVVEKHLPISLEMNESNSPGFYFMNYIANPEGSPSYNKLISPEYGNTELRVTADNAKYKDCCKLLLDNLNLEKIVQLYLDIEETTGYSIRYYGVEGYDMQIFPVFSFLSDKGTHGFVTMEDDYQVTYYIDRYGLPWKEELLLNMSMAERQDRAPFSPRTEWKDSFYQTMVYRAYKDACGGLKHFRLEYASPYGYPGEDYSAVLISKFYPGCYITGNVTFGTSPLEGAWVGVYDDYGIRHDLVSTDVNGAYQLVSIPGNITLAVITGQDVIATQQKIVITKDQANRLTDYEVIYHLQVDSSALEFSVSNYTAEHVFYLNSESFSSDPVTILLDEEGKSFIEGLLPGKYRVDVFNATGRMQNESFTLYSGNNTYKLVLDTIE